MTWLWVLLVIAVGVCVALVAYIGVRDRRRMSSRDDEAANREATSIAERHNAYRHGQQSGRNVRDQMHGGS
jgi:hypothetical protein